MENRIDGTGKLSFGEMVRRERIKSGKSLKVIEEHSTKKETVIKDGQEVEEEKVQITASYLNRIEKGNRENISFNIVCFLIQELNLDINEVFESFGYKDIVSKNVKHENIEEIFRLNDFKGPIKIGNKEENKPLSATEIEILINIIKGVFEFGITDEDSIIYVLRRILNDLDDYRKSRRRTADSLIDNTTK